MRIYLPMLLLLGRISGQDLPRPTPDRAELQIVKLGAPPMFPADLSGLMVAQADKPGVIAEQAQGAGLSVNPSNREQARTFFNTYYLGASGGAINWTGNRSTCNEGTTATDFKDSVALRINYFRAMAGVPAQVNLDEVYGSKSQKSALMMSVNQQLSHNPPVTWTCYSSAGAEAASKSNLALGEHGWNAIDMYVMDPGDGNGAVGHRRWVLYPQTQTMGTGDIPGDSGWASNDLWVFDAHIWDPRPATREEFVAWPPPGYVPYQVVYPRWSFSYAGADFSQASVTMSLNQQLVGVALESVRTGYGENTLVWMPAAMTSWDVWPKPSSDRSYRITVSNVLIQGVARTFSYDVIVFDPTMAGARADFDGNGVSDLVWRYKGSGPYQGSNSVWFMDVADNSGTWTKGFRMLPAVSDLNCDIAGTADFDGDGVPDILWRYNGTGAYQGSNSIWYMNSDGSMKGFKILTAVSDLSWQIGGCWDMDGDGVPDIVWRNYGTGAYQGWNSIWYMKADGSVRSFKILTAVADTNWQIAGGSDFDGDGVTDLLWRYYGAGMYQGWNSIWYMNVDGTMKGSKILTSVPDLNWRICATGNFDKDGKPDILWRYYGTGTYKGWNSVWFMNADGSLKAWQLLDVVPDTNWIVKN